MFKNWMTGDDMLYPPVSVLVRCGITIPCIHDTKWCPNYDYQHPHAIANMTFVLLSLMVGSSPADCLWLCAPFSSRHLHHSMEAALPTRFRFRGQKLEQPQQGCHTFLLLVLIRLVAKQDRVAVVVETTGAWDILEHPGRGLWEASCTSKGGIPPEVCVGRHFALTEFIRVQVLALSKTR